MTIGRIQLRKRILEIHNIETKSRMIPENREGT